MITVLDIVGWNNLHVENDSEAIFASPCSTLPFLYYSLSPSYSPLPPSPSHTFHIYCTLPSKNMINCNSVFFISFCDKPIPSFHLSSWWESFFSRISLFLLPVLCIVFLSGNYLRTKLHTKHFNFTTVKPLQSFCFVFCFVLFLFFLFFFYAVNFKITFWII